MRGLARGARAWGAIVRGGLRPRFPQENRKQYQSCKHVEESEPRRTALDHLDYCDFLPDYCDPLLHRQLQPLWSGAAASIALRSADLITRPRASVGKPKTRRNS